MYNLLNVVNYEYFEVYLKLCLITFHISNFFIV